MKLDANIITLAAIAGFLGWYFWPQIKGYVTPLLSKLGSLVKQAEADTAKDDRTLLDSWWALYGHCRAANCTEGMKALNDLLPHLHSHEAPAPEAK